MVAALDAQIEQPVAQLLERRPALGPSPAGRTIDSPRRRGPPAMSSGARCAADILVGDDDHRPPRASGARRSPARQQTGLDQDLIAARAQTDIDTNHRPITFRIAHGRFVRAAGGHTDWRQRVDGIADRGQFGEHLSRGSRPRSSGRVSRRPTRSASTATSASSQIAVACSRISAGLVVHEGAAAGGDHLGRAVDQPLR
jgi:hypothetical protein